MLACLLLPPAPVSSGGPSRSLDLLAFGRTYSPRVEVIDEGLAVLDVGGLERWFGDLKTLGATLRKDLADRGHPSRVALAPSRMPAVLMAVGRAGLSLVPAGGEAGAVAPLPLGVLEQALGRIERGPGGRAAGRPGGQEAGRPGSQEAGRPGSRRSVPGGCRHYRMAPAPAAEPAATAESEIFRTLHRWGLTTCGELAALPAADLYERLGAGGLRLQRYAAGGDWQPLVSTPVPPDFEERLVLEWPLEALEPLAFVVARLLEPLSGRLEREDAGAAVLHVWLRLTSRETCIRSLQLPSPLRDPRTLRTLVMLDLESHPPAAGVDEIRIAIEPVPGRVVQFSLLERAVPSPERLSTLLARLSALMGEGRCGMAALPDTHRPGAFELRPFGDVADRAPARLPPDSRPSGVAVRRYRQPVPATVRLTAGRPSFLATPHHRGAIRQCAGPWRTSGHWWMTPGEPWDRDEWDVGLAEGTVVRIFRDRTQARWFVDGVLD